MTDHHMARMGAPEFQVGDAVMYRPGHGGRAEDGVVTGLSNDPSLVFVRYRSQHPGARGQATPKTCLTKPGEHS